MIKKMLAGAVMTVGLTGTASAFDNNKLDLVASTKGDNSFAHKLELIAMDEQVEKPVKKVRPPMPAGNDASNPWQWEEAKNGEEGYWWRWKVQRPVYTPYNPNNYRPPMLMIP